MALTIARTETQLAATTAFQAMDNLMASSVSSSFVAVSYTHLTLPTKRIV